MAEKIPLGWRERRDQKMAAMLDPDEPAWLVDENVEEKSSMIFFAIVHRWAPGGWARRLYMYDPTGHVLHFRGTTPLEESDLVKLKAEQRFLHHHPGRTTSR